LHDPALARQHYSKVVALDPRNPQAPDIQFWLSSESALMGSLPDEKTPRKLCRCKGFHLRQHVSNAGWNQTNWHGIGYNLIGILNWRI